MRKATLFFIIMILGFFGLGYMHERVHVEIYRNHGIESHIEYLSHFPHWITIAEKPCPTDSCKLAHDINEVVGYQLAPFYIIIGLGLLCMIVFLEDINERRKYG